MQRVWICASSIGDVLGMAIWTKTVGMNQSINGPVDHTHVLALEDDFDFSETDGLGMCRLFHLN